MEQANLTAQRGDTEEYTLYFKDSDGMVIDITGWVVFFTVKENLDDTDANAKISKTITDHTDPINGETVLKLTPTDTNLVGNYLYDIQIKKANGDIKTILQGTIDFGKDITQRTS